MRRIIAVMLVRSILAGSIVLSTPSFVFAQDTAEGVDADEEKFTTLTSQATEAYENGDYAEAIALFEQAYELRPVSNILYNIGRIHEDAGNIDEAIEAYDKFVVAPNVAQSARRDALDRLKTLREVRAVRDGSQTAAEPPETEPKPVVVAERVEERPNTGQTLGWVFVGVGGASLITAGVFGLLAQSQFEKFEEATTLPDRRDAATAGRTNAVVADSLLVTGIVAAAAGAIVLLVSSGDAESNPGSATDAGAATWTVSPMVGRRAVGMGLELSF